MLSFTENFFLNLDYHKCHTISYTVGSCVFLQYWQSKTEIAISKVIIIQGREVIKNRCEEQIKVQVIQQSPCVHSQSHTQLELEAASAEGFQIFPTPFSTPITSYHWLCQFYCHFFWGGELMILKVELICSCFLKLKYPQEQDGVVRHVENRIITPILQMGKNEVIQDSMRCQKLIRDCYVLAQ